MRTLKDLDVKNKTVLLRTEFNVPVKDGFVHDDFRIQASIPTISYLRERGARIVILSHRGRPGGIVDPELSLRFISKYLERIGSFPVAFHENILDEHAKDIIKNLQAGEVLMAENIRFYPGEEANDKQFAAELAELGDVYVNDAFGAIHRYHASQVWLPTLLPSSAGLLIEKEVRELEAIRNNPKRPFVLIMGGAKVKTKIRVIQYFLKKADAICLGGIIANTILAYKGMSTGKSIVASGLEKYIKLIPLTDSTLHLPLDVIVSTDMSGEMPIREIAAGNVEEGEMILDIGRETRTLFSNIIKDAGTVVWNGPLGLSEVEAFARGTAYVARSLRDTKGRVIIGGGDVIDAVRSAGLEERIDFFSTGGGAMLEYLAGEELPGLEALGHSQTGEALT